MLAVKIIFDIKTGKKLFIYFINVMYITLSLRICQRLRIYIQLRYEMNYSITHIYCPICHKILRCWGY